MEKGLGRQGAQKLSESGENRRGRGWGGDEEDGRGRTRKERADIDRASDQCAALPRVVGSSAGAARLGEAAAALLSAKATAAAGAALRRSAVRAAGATAALTSRRGLAAETAAVALLQKAQTVKGKTRNMSH